ncbi:MAG TPA: hypothetical protein VHW02_07985 [Rhizomicrobium sp.]|jgi:hypothetical protein|nr:hypothetical protein [Rhizomicrobium sp.]
MTKHTMKKATLRAGRMETEPKIAVDYWQACDLIGEDAAAKLWGNADADQEERLKITKPAKPRA